jgi:hypothetical protein
MADAACRHCTMEQIIDLVLNSAHERLRTRCDRSKIIDLLEEKHGAYDVHAVCLLLARKYDGVEEQLELAGAAPPAFLAALWPLVQPPESTSAAQEEAGAGPSELPLSEPPPSKPTTSSCGKQLSLGSFFGKGTTKHYEKLPTGGRVLSGVTEMTEEQLKAMPMVTAGLCSKGCGLAFTHAPAKVAHEKVCKGGTNTATAAALAAAARSPSPTSCMTISYLSVSNYVISLNTVLTITTRTQQ